MIREKIKITEKRNGKEEFDFINLIDFENTENNKLKKAIIGDKQSQYQLYHVNCIYDYQCIRCAKYNEIRYNTQMFKHIVSGLSICSLCYNKL